MKALIVKTEGAVEPIEVDGLRDKQRAVGGYIEYFGVFEDRGFTIIINEDGLFTCPPNRAIFGDASLEEAGYLSQFSHEYRPVRDGELYAILCGDFLVVGFDPATCEERDLTPEAEAIAREMFERGASGLASGLIAASAVKTGAAPSAEDVAFLAEALA